jgi:hypothetical protein
MFSRGSRTGGRHSRGDRSRNPRSLADELEVAEDLVPPARHPVEPVTQTGLPAGPYDITGAPDGVARLDLGSLKIPSVPGVEVRVQANQEGVIQQVLLVDGESVLQLGVFAAPRTEPLWDEVRAEIRRSLFSDGVAAEEVPGDYGTELRARVRTPQGLKDLRFVGVDGPRWLVRAVYQGPAAVDPAAGYRLAECLRGLVVDRGNEAKPVKEPLPLRLSEEMAAQLRERAAAGPATNGAPASVAVPSGEPPPNPPAAPRRRPSPRPRRD